MSDDECPPLCEMETGDSNGEEEDADEWKVAEEQNDPVRCLFCEQISPTMTTAIRHARERHEFDLGEVRRRFHLDEYVYIKMINYIRLEKPDPSVFKNGTSVFWSDDKYLKPVENETWLMFDLDELDEILLNGNRTGSSGDEEVGDGTTSVIVLAGEMLAVAEQFLQQQIHPTVIIRAYREALEDMIKLLENDVSIPMDKTDKAKLAEVVKSCVGTKFIGRWSDMAVKIALDAVETVMLTENGRTEIDIKKYAKVEKIPGGSIDESCVLKGVMLNKDVTHPKMRRYIENPRIVLLDSPLEYKKGESQTNVESSAIRTSPSCCRSKRNMSPRLAPTSSPSSRTLSLPRRVSPIWPSTTS